MENKVVKINGDDNHVDNNDKYNHIMHIEVNGVGFLHLEIHVTHCPHDGGRQAPVLLCRQCTAFLLFKSDGEFMY